MGKKMTNEEFVKKVYDLVGDEYTFLERYQGTHTKIKVIHNKCGNQYSVEPNSFVNAGHRCNKCSLIDSTNRQRKDIDVFLKQISEIDNGTILVKGEYLSSRQPLLFFHTICEREFYARPYNLFRKRRCSLCGIEKGIKSRTRTNEEFSKELYDLYGGEYILEGGYTQYKEKVLIKHTKCGYSWMVCVDNILHNHGCPNCKISKGERRVEKGLINLGLDINVDFFEQHRFDDCKNKRKLPFDFYIPMFNIIVEYDGIGHYKPIRPTESFSKSFNNTLYNDSIKTKYCEQNNIKLVRIPYTSFNEIEQILEKELSPYLRKEVNG